MEWNRNPEVASKPGGRKKLEKEFVLWVGTEKS
jgi:hypothetical protein